MKKIVVATDFSRASHKAFLFAIRMARKIDAEVLAVFVVNTTDLRFAIREDFPDVTDHTSDELKREVEKHIEGQFQKMRKRYGEGYERVRTIHIYGIPSIEIEKISSREAAGMLVVGTRSRSLPVQFVLGSTAQDLVRHAKRPVVTVRSDTRIQ